jgi:hypothetical protein
LLKRVVVADSNKVIVRQAGGIAPLVAALRSSDEKLSRDAMRAIRNLAFDSACRPCE